MWGLTKNIYRFTPMDRNASAGIHTVDEHLLFDDHISGEEPVEPLATSLIPLLSPRYLVLPRAAQERGCG